MLGSLRKRTPGTPLSLEELEQRREAGRASAAKRRRSIGDYEREVRAIPILTHNEERELVSRWQQGDTRARDRLVEAHLRLAVSGARKLAGYGLPVDDLVAAGNIGLLQAAERYDPTKGARFTTFAAPYIRAAQLRHVLDNWSIVRLGTDRDQKRLFFSLRGELRHIHGQASSEKVREIAERRGVKATAVKQMAERLAGRDASLNVRAGEDEDGEEWLERLSGGEHAEDRLVARETDRIRRATVARAMARLNDRERRVLAARWLRDPPATLQQVGHALGISAERVRQIEAQAMRRVRAAVAAEPRLSKRTPGTPLSDEELRQRREAARSRWATGGGALAGALAATYAGRGAAAMVARRKLAADESGMRALRLAQTRRATRHEKIEAAVAWRKGQSRRKFNVWPGTETGPKLGPVNRRLRDLGWMRRQDEADLRRAEARLRELDEAFTGGRPASPGMGEGQAQRIRSDRRTRLADSAAEIEELQQAKPWRRTARDEHPYQRSRTGWRSGSNPKVRPSLSDKRLREIRGAVRARAEEVANEAHRRIDAAWPRAARRFHEAFRTRAAKVITRRLRGRWALPAVIGGAVAGAAAGYGASRLAKVAPPDDMPFERPDIETPSAAAEEAALAAKLAALFRSWLEHPERVGSREDVAEALGPLYGVLRAGAEAAVPPPPAEDSLYGPPEGRTLAISFDARSPEVERRLREYALDRIRAITEESREAIRAALVEAAQQGAPVDEQARRIREAIGLSPGQQGWVTSYRRGLEVLDPRVLQRALRDRRHDGPIRRAIETSTPLAAEDIDRYVASYQRRALAYRAITIARTEALRGANTGMVESARVMLQQHPDVTVEKTWIATRDARTRDAHRELDGKMVVGLDTPFEFGGEQIRWPHDPQASPAMTVNCRCSLGLRLIPKPGHGRFIAEAA